MHVDSIDHFVLVVADVARTCDFYGRVLGMEAREMSPGRCISAARRSISSRWA